ncbi:MAG: hypothetical protein HYV95_17775 [Opitutae bacterium]|nr:hypothetical protein [Opitutae bacterium]
MKGWLGDLLRGAWALLYWNTRKSWFIVRGRPGQCPCHNPSDSGEPLKTGCEAVLGWNTPGRFRNVCPLLVCNEKGAWVCSAAPAKVRPFWARAFGFYGAVLAAVYLLAGFSVWGALRGIGYRVTVRQVIWPRAWSELQAVRAQIFIDQAQEHYRAGRIREAIRALSVAYGTDPNNYALAMMLAQFYQAGNPEAADRIYLRMLQVHPEQRHATGQAWFLSLLARGRLADVAMLAQRALPTEPEQAAGWTHALIFATRLLHRPDLLEATAFDGKLPIAVGTTLLFEARVQRATGAEALAILRAEPLVSDFPYARLQRAELFIRAGQPREALALMAASQKILSGRDVVRLALAAYAVAGDDAVRRREAAELLSPARQIGEAELTLLAQHLIGHPDPVILASLAEGMKRLGGTEAATRREIWLNYLCALGASGDEARFAQGREQALAAGMITNRVGARLKEYFFPTGPRGRIETLLPSLSGLSADLSYVLLQRYWEPPSGGAAVPNVRLD